MADTGLSQQDMQDLMQVRSMLPQGDPRADKIDRLLMNQPQETITSAIKPLKPSNIQSGESFADFMQRLKDSGTAPTVRQTIPSDLVKQQTEVKLSNPSTVPNARIRNLPNPAQDMTMREALLSGAATGTELASLPATAIGGGEVVAGLKNILPLATQGAINLGKWASANPVKAYLLYQLAKEAIPGVKKGSQFIKNAPTE